MALLRWGTVAGLCLLACGEPLQDTEYAGEPRFTFDGIIQLNPGNLALPDAPIRVNVFWLPGALEPEDGVEAAATGRRIEPPGRYTLWIFELPPAEALRPGGFAIGGVYAYVDTNDNGRREADEPFFGAMRETAIVWSAGGVDDPMFVHTVPPDFVPLRLPFACGAVLEQGTATDCGVDLGAECSEDADCGPGLCVTQFFGSAAGRLCTLPIAPGYPECRPADGAKVPVRDAAFQRVGATEAWARTCARDADCPRADYHCAPGTGLCLPTPDLEIELEGESRQRGWCFDERVDGGGRDDDDDDDDGEPGNGPAPPPPPPPPPND